MQKAPFLLLLVALGCRDGGRCAGDGDCRAPGTRCSAALQECICIADEACPEDAFCNRLGVCQQRAGCSRNAECGEGTFCDISTGTCLPGPSDIDRPCGLASHCLYGTVCAGGSCKPGCFDHGDCPLGQVCQDGGCVEGVCASDSFCEFGERCVQSRCRPDRRGPYCRGCSTDNNAQVTPCDEPRNFCLVNNFERGGAPTICGVDCSLGQPCPHGYQCNSVLTLTGDVCTFDAQCKCDPRGIQIPEVACSGDSECERGSVCVGGVCCAGPVQEDRQCVVGEGRTSGFCTCATDDDCPQDVCDGLMGTCTFTRRPCTPGAGDCGAIACISGACLIGANCAPIQGLSCSEVSPR